MVMGENGIFTKAKNAKNQTIEQEAYETVSLVLLSARTEYEINKNIDLEQYVKKENKEIAVEQTGNGDILDKWKFTYKEYEFQIYDLKIQLQNQLYLYNEGDECLDITGGWEVGQNQENGIAGKNTDNIQLSYSSQYNTESYTKTINDIDLKGYTKLYIDYSINSVNGSLPQYKCLYLELNGEKKRLNETTVGDYTGYFELNENSNYKICLLSYNSNIYIRRVWLEK